MACVQLLQFKPTGATDGANGEDWTKTISALKSGHGIVSVAWALQHEDPKIAGIAISRFERSCRICPILTVKLRLEELR
jgi:hypothetical protein